MRHAFSKIPRASARGRATSPSANVVPRRGTEVFRFLIFTAPTALRLAPARLTQSSTSFRNRRLMRGARLLLLPALGLLCALFRCLRHLPSLLRHAALLAVSEWRCRPCPRGSRTLHWDYYSVIKKPVFLQHQAHSHLRRQHGVRPQQRAQNARHAAQHDCATSRRRFFRMLGNAHKIWLSDAFYFLRDCSACAERVTRVPSPNRPQ